jgi:hypothetical protein
MAEVYTVRGGIYEVAALDAAQVLALYRPELERAGFTVPQEPLVTPRVTNVQTSSDGPIRRIEISAPPFDATSQVRDTRVSYADDPAKLAELGQARLSTFTWNLCGPSDALGALRELFRRVKPYGTLKLSPVVSTFAAAPIELSGFPPRPALISCVRPSSSPGGGGAAAAGGVLAFLALLLGARALSRRRA